MLSSERAVVEADVENQTAAEEREMAAIIYFLLYSADEQIRNM